MEETKLSFDVAITKTELFDVEKMQWLLRSDKLSKEDKFRLSKYYKRKHNINQVGIVYQLGEKSKTFEHSGRFVVGKGGVGLQSFPRDIRNFLAESYYWDIDMENAQPSILWQYAEHEGYAHQNIKKFCSKREDILNEIMKDGLTRSEAKDRIIQLFFGSDYVDGLPDFIRNKLYPELKLIRENIAGKNHSLLKKLSKRPNPSASVMAHVLQTEEREILLKISEALKLENRDFDVLMHDGGYIRKLKGETEFPQHLLEKCEKYVYDKLKYSIKLANKPIATTIVMEDSDLISEDVIVNDMYAAKKFAELMGDDLVNDNGIIYVYYDNLWSDNVDYLNRHICEMGDKLVFKKIGGVAGTIIYDYSGSVKNRENLKKMLPDILELKHDFLEQGRKLALNKLLFKNGIYDFMTNKLLPFDRNVVFSFKIHFDFEFKENQEDIDFIHKVFFEDPFDNTEVPKIFKHFLMRGLIGDYKCKKFMVCVGPTNSSKGMLQEFLHYIFSGYVGHFNGNSLVSRFNTEGTRDIGWFLPLADTRLCFGSEIKADKSSLINSEIVKQIVSGGETIVLRQLYKEEKPVVPRTMPILFCNEIPAFTSMNDAILNRIISIVYDHSFVEFPTKEYQRLAKPNLKSTLKSQNYADAFIHLIIREFQKWQEGEFAELPLPESIKSFREEIVNIEDIEEILEDQFEITKNKDDFITNKELEEYFKDKGIEMSMVKATLMLKQVRVETIVKKIGKKTIKVKVGIKRKDIQ